MAKPQAFWNSPAGAAVPAARERIRDWDEIALPLPEEPSAGRPPAAWTAACHSAMRRALWPGGVVLPERKSHP
jgi:hypothetical protein